MRIVIDFPAPFGLMHPTIAASAVAPLSRASSRVGEKICGTIGVMAGPGKNGYVVDLSARQFDVALNRARTRCDAAIRPVVPADAEALAELMLAAYRGTIDYEGEEIEEAREAVADFFSDAPMLDASMIACVDGAAASAVLLTSLDADPFISHVFSDPTHQRKGLAAQVVTAACQRLVDTGEREVRCAITNGNLASEALFDRFGALRLSS